MLGRKECLLEELDHAATAALECGEHSARTASQLDTLAGRTHEIQAGTR